MPKRKVSFINDVIELTSKTPWWFRVLLAIVSYFIFHFIGGLQIEKATGMDDLGGLLYGTVLVSMSNFLPVGQRNIINVCVLRTR